MTNSPELKTGRALIQDWPPSLQGKVPIQHVLWFLMGGNSRGATLNVKKARIPNAKLQVDHQGLASASKKSYRQFVASHGSCFTSTQRN